MIDKRQFISKYCDVETKDGVWRLGIVEGGKGNKEDKEVFEVYLDGWSSNKIQKVCLHSSRVQPPRYFSRGYTGQKSVPLRNLNFDMAQISYIVNWLKLFHNFDFKNMPILEITNLFRCQMFILVDSILFHPWSLSDNIVDDMRKVESLFNNIVQISVIYMEKIPKFLAEINGMIYERHSYLSSFPISYLEASYELFLTLKNIFGFNKRSENFFSEYHGYFRTNFLNEFIDLGCVNLLNRFLKEFVNNKIFEDKFYLIANILELNVRIITRSHHQKLNKSNQLKIMTEITNFFYRENFVDLLNKNEDDVDVMNLVEAIIEFAKMNKNFVVESQRFGSFIKAIKQEENVFSKNSIKSPMISGMRKPPARYFSDTGLKLKALTNLKTMISKNPTTESPTKQEKLSAQQNPPQLQVGNEFLSKLQEIESKLTKLEHKLTPIKVPNENQSHLQKSDTTEFNIITPIKQKQDPDAYHNLINETNFSKFNDTGSFFINQKESYFSVSDPYDEFAILSFISNSLERHDHDSIKKIIEWRKKILHISKNNGWVVGKLLASKTIKKLEISDEDIISANLKFMEHFSLIEKHKYNTEEVNLFLNLDYKSLLRDYEKQLLVSLDE